MKTKERKLTAVLLAMVLALSLASCTLEKPPTVDVDLPTTTSEEANAYAMGDQIYNAEGVLLAYYAFDEDGNIVDENGDVVVAADLVALFTCVESAVAAEETKFSISAEKLEDETLATRPVVTTFTMKFEPKDPVNGIVTLESRDPGALYFTYDDNKDLFAGEIDSPTDNALPAITMDVSDGCEVMITVVGTFEGDYTITARNCFNEPIGEIVVSFVPEYVEDLGVEDGGDIGEHEHVFADTIVAPTQKSQGYTVHVCELCGYTFRDNYVDALPCQHDYKDTVVPATYTTGGYTLHVCTICGNSYKDSETPVLTCRHETTKDTVVAPTCSEQGYTLHECTVCKNYSYKDSYKDPTGHKWDSGKTTKNPTCGTAGEKTFTCKTCKATKTEPIPATGNHNYVESVMPAICDEGGYTQHTCSVCGDSYRDAQTPALGHTDPQWRTIKEATCGEAGVREGVCTRCGRVIATESIPKTGNHSYTSSVMPPTCDEGGYTTHTCSVCGHSYTDSQTAALGHLWEAHTEHVVVGHAVHTLCGACGFDFTAHGYSGAQASEHMKAHALAGESSRTYDALVDIYDDVTTYVCTRCGRTQ